MTTHVLYHSPCPDGTAAAAAAYLALGDGATYHPVNYSGSRPTIPDGAKVYLLDFSYPRAELEALAARSERVTVLDHHATAAEALAGLLSPYDLASAGRELVAHFDMHKAGCELAWEFFHGTKTPHVVRWVADRDLWRFVHHDTKAFAAWLQTQESSVTHYAYLLQALEDETQREYVVKVGIELVAQQDAQVERIISHAQVTEFPLPEVSGGGQLIAVNTSLHQSEACHALLEKFPRNDVVAAWYVAANGDQRWSLRARKDGCDVAAIAKLYGGGGHRAAAGFVIPATPASSGEAGATHA